MSNEFEQGSDAPKGDVQDPAEPKHMGERQETESQPEPGDDTAEGSDSEDDSSEQNLDALKPEGTVAEPGPSGQPAEGMVEKGEYTHQEGTAPDGYTEPQKNERFPGRPGDAPANYQPPQQNPERHHGEGTPARGNS